MRPIETGSSASYLPIGIQFIFAILFVGVMMGLTHFFGPKRSTSDKLENFESGIAAVGNARQPMAVKYFLVAISVCTVRCGSDFSFTLMQLTSGS